MEVQKFKSFSGGAHTFIADGNNSALAAGRGTSEEPFESSTGELYGAHEHGAMIVRCTVAVGEEGGKGQKSGWPRLWLNDKQRWGAVAGRADHLHIALPIGFRKMYTLVGF